VNIKKQSLKEKFLKVSLNLKKQLYFLKQDSIVKNACFLVLPFFFASDIFSPAATQREFHVMPSKLLLFTETG
jgi:hypothetical protein